MFNKMNIAINDNIDVNIKHNNVNVNININITNKILSVKKLTSI